MSSCTKKPVFLLVVMTLVVAFVFAACAQEAAPAKAPEPSKPAAAAPKAAEPAKAAPAAKPPIKIGLLLPLTGSFALLAKDNQDGHSLYLDKIGNQVAGRKIELVVEDTEAKGDVALTKARKLVENDKVNIVAGLLTTTECYAAAPYVAEKKVPTVVTANCGAEGLTKDPKMRSPYIWRTTQTSGMFGYAASGWLMKNGYKKAVVISSGFAGGYEVVDGFARSYIEEGGTIVQEIYPAIGTTDFGPFMGQIKSDADVVVSFVIGTDGLRFAQQYSEYGWKSKLPLIDLSAVIVGGPNLEQLKDVAVGIIASIHYATDTDTPENKEFLKDFATKYKGRLLSHDVAAGYTGMQIIATALQAADGNVEDTDKFLSAMKKVELKTAKGSFKFDEYQNVVEDFYLKRIDKVDGKYVEKTLAVVPNVSQFWKWQPDTVIKYPFSKLFGKYTNINKEQLQELLKPYLQ